MNYISAMQHVKSDTRMTGELSVTATPINMSKKFCNVRIRRDI